MPKSRYKTCRCHDQVAVKQSGDRIILAADAAVDHQLVSIGYIATTGHFGCYSRWQPEQPIDGDDITIAELRAIYHGLRHIVDTARPVTILTDSLSAHRYIRHWLAGEETFPPGYRLWSLSGKPPSLVKLSQRVAAWPGLTVEWVKAHDGHALNELADSLAKLALRRSRNPDHAPDPRTVTPLWAARALQEFTQCAA